MVLMVMLAILLLVFAVIAAYLLWGMTSLARSRAYCWKVRPCDDVPFAQNRLKKLCKIARARGFQPCGLFLDESRIKWAESYMSFWLNKSRDALVLFLPYRFVGEDDLPEVPWNDDPPEVPFEVLTLLVNGIYLITKSSFTSEITGGGWREMECLEGEVTLSRLLYRHEQRLQKCGMKPQTIPPENAVQFYETYERERIDRLVRLGRAKYLDKNKTCWRHKSRGSIKSSALHIKYAWQKARDESRGA